MRIIFTIIIAAIGIWLFTILESNLTMATPKQPPILYYIGLVGLIIGAIYKVWTYDYVVDPSEFEDMDTENVEDSEVADTPSQDPKPN